MLERDNVRHLLSLPESKEPPGIIILSKDVGGGFRDFILQIHKSEPFNYGFFMIAFIDLERETLKVVLQNEETLSISLEAIEALAFPPKSWRNLKLSEVFS